GRRRRRLAALHPRHRARDEAGHPGRAALPHARRVPDLRQHLHPDPGVAEHPLGLDPELRPAVHGTQPGGGLGHVGADLHRGGADRVHLHQGLRRRRARSGPTMRSTPRQKLGWSIANVLVLVIAAIPVLWLISLSFKDPSTLTDGSFYPHKWT